MPAKPRIGEMVLYEYEYINVQFSGANVGPSLHVPKMVTKSLKKSCKVMALCKLYASFLKNLTIWMTLERSQRNKKNFDEQKTIENEKRFALPLFDYRSRQWASCRRGEASVFSFAPRTKFVDIFPGAACTRSPLSRIAAPWRPPFRGLSTHSAPLVHREGPAKEHSKLKFLSLPFWTLFLIFCYERVLYPQVMSMNVKWP